MTAEILEVGMYRVMRARVWMAVCRVRGLGRGRGRDAGMATSEYAVGILAAVGIAMAFYKVVTSDAVSAQLAAIVSRALSAAV